MRKKLTLLLAFSCSMALLAAAALGSFAEAAPIEESDVPIHRKHGPTWYVPPKILEYINDSTLLRVANRTQEAHDHHVNGIGYFMPDCGDEPWQCQPGIGDLCTWIGLPGCCRRNDGAMVKCICDARYDPVYNYWYGVWTEDRTG